MENEIIMNEEIMETVEDISTVGSGNGLKVVAGIGAVAVAGVLIWKGGKWLKAKLANRKNKQENVEPVEAEVIEDEIED